MTTHPTGPTARLARATRHAVTARHPLASGLVVALVAALAWLGTPGDSAAQEPYKIGVDDVLGISVWDNKDLDQQVFVRPDGKISLPLLGEIQAGGRTVAELEATLAEQYRKTVKGAQVTVLVKAINSRAIFFIGGVGKTGPMQLTQDLTLLQAISAAGGAAPGADMESSYVLRGTQLIRVDLTKLIQKGDISQNVKLQPGDTVVVPLADAVYIEGDVKRPGPIKHTRELSLLDAIAQAGGFTDLAVPKRVSIVRGDGLKKETLEVNVNEMVKKDGAAQDFPLKPKDVVVVTIADVVYLQGEVRSPAAIKFTKDLTVLKAIAQVGGFTNLAAASRVSLVRGDGVKRETTRLNVDDMMKGTTPDVPLQANDIILVPQRLF